MSVCVSTLARARVHAHELDGTQAGANTRKNRRAQRRSAEERSRHVFWSDRMMYCRSGRITVSVVRA